MDRRPRTPAAHTRRYRIADFDRIAGVPRPCRAARRAFQDALVFPPLSLRRRERGCSWTMSFFPKPGMRIMIRSGARHRPRHRRDEGADHGSDAQRGATTATVARSLPGRQQNTLPGRAGGAGLRYLDRY